jgi:hypothetical protein
MFRGFCPAPASVCVKHAASLGNARAARLPQSVTCGQWPLACMREYKHDTSQTKNFKQLLTSKTFKRVQGCPVSSDTFIHPSIHIDRVVAGTTNDSPMGIVILFVFHARTSTFARAKHY